jgi:uncharacterized membrane-anchored protein
MRKAVALLAGLAVLAFVNFGIWQRERLVTEGRVVLLALAPIDPRSFMQGDYMRLSFEVARDAFPPGSLETRADGRIVVALDEHQVGHFRRFADRRPLAPGEVALRYRVRAGEPNFATNAFFFEEGQAQAYAAAAYGEFRVASDGEMILTGMRDARFAPLKGAPGPR